MSDRIQLIFNQGKAHIAYLTAGDGGIEKTFAAALALIAGGVNLLEIGIPFSDPVADGPVIERAHQRALAARTHPSSVLRLVKAIREKSDVPIVIFTYLNPLLQANPETYLQQAKAAGVDGLLVVDCPIEESNFLQTICHKNALALIQVIASSTPADRVKLIASQATGFLYYACQKGTTGMRENLPAHFKEQIKIIKSISALPVVVGFGVSHQDMVKCILAEADGCVVGSYFVDALERTEDPTQLMQLAFSLFP